jgi:hypothetical protein
MHRLMGCRLEGGGGFVGEDAGEVGAIGVDQDELKQGCDQTWADAVTAQDEGVEGKDVDDDGAEDDEAEGCGASDEDEQATEDLTETNDMHPSGGAHDSHELGGWRAGGRRLHGHEGMEDVGAEDDKHQAEQDAADEVEVFHEGRHSLVGWVER